MVIEDDTINAGAATTTNQPPVILAKEQHQSDTNQEQPKSKVQRITFHHIGHVNGVSMYYLRTILTMLQEQVRDAPGIDEDTATIYDMENLNNSKHECVFAAYYCYKMKISRQIRVDFDYSCLEIKRERKIGDSSRSAILAGVFRIKGCENFYSNSIK